MGKVIAITNQKGGVGKTTTCVNLAASLADAGRRVLLIDFDPQGNATMGSGVDKRDLQITMNEVLVEDVDVTSALAGTSAGFDLLPANARLTVAEVSLLRLTRRELRLRQAISRIRQNYEYILIDCPPALSMLTVNALVAADSVLIPVQCEYYALEGLASLLETIREVQTRLNPKLQIEGVLRTMYDSRNRLTNDVSEQLFSHFSEKVYETVIPRNVRLAEAPSHGLPVLLYDRTSAGAIAYRRLSEELLQRQVSAAAV